MTKNKTWLWSSFILPLAQPFFTGRKILLCLCGWYHAGWQMLFYYNDYSIEQIAAVLKIPKGTVKSRLHKARNILREALSYEQERAYE